MPYHYDDDEPIDEDTWKEMCRRWYHSIKAEWLTRQHGDPQYVPHNLIIFNTPEYIRPYLEA